MRKVVVMAGGQGARLKPLTLTRPKPLVPIANCPVMAHILEWLRRQGFTEILVTLHYRADDIRQAFGDGRSLGLEITYREEKAPLGTAGSVKDVEDWLGGEPFLIVSGDALTDVDLGTLCREHRASGAWVTLGLQRVPDPSDYGVVALDARDRIVRFQEKPPRGEAFSDLANTGIYCIEPAVLAQISRGLVTDWSRDVFPRLLAEGRLLHGHVMEGYWRDIGSHNSYRRGQRDALDRAVQLRLPGTELQPGIWAGTKAHISPGAVIDTPVLLGAGCCVQRSAHVHPGSVVGDGTIIHGGAQLWGATLGAGCEIGREAILYDCVLDDHVSVGPRCRILPGAVLGHTSRLGADVDVAPGEQVEPGQGLDGTRTRFPTAPALSSQGGAAHGRLAGPR